MGYNMHQVDSKFVITADKQGAAIKALNDLPAERYRWTQHRKYKRLEDSLCNWGWEVSFGYDGVGEDITNISFFTEKLGDETILFDIIAPFVKAGSYIEMQGEDGARWRWVFDGKTCKEVAAKITWE